MSLHVGTMSHAIVKGVASPFSPMFVISNCIHLEVDWFLFDIARVLGDSKLRYWHTPFISIIDKIIIQSTKQDSHIPV